MTTANVTSLHNPHFFKSLKEIMDTNDTNMCIDGAGTLWHINDIEEILHEDNVELIGA